MSDTELCAPDTELCVPDTELCVPHTELSVPLTELCTIWDENTGMGSSRSRTVDACLGMVM